MKYSLTLTTLLSTTFITTTTTAFPINTPVTISALSFPDFEQPTPPQRRPLTSNADDTASADFIPQQIPLGPFHLMLESPSLPALHNQYLLIKPTTNPTHKLAITTTTASKPPKAQFALHYNDPNTDERFPPFGRLMYTPTDDADSCKWWSCPPELIPAAYDANFGPVEFVRNNMRAVFFDGEKQVKSVPAALNVAAADGDAGKVGGGNEEGEFIRIPEDRKGERQVQLQVWGDFQVDFSGYLTLGGKNNWYACPTEYPWQEGERYMSVWWADGLVSDERCQKVRVRRIN